MVFAMTGFDLARFLPYRLAVAAGRVSAAFSERYAERFGLTIPEWRIMAHLSQGAALSIRDLHLRADLEKSKASRAAARLEAAGLVEKRPAPDDRRLVALTLSEKGRAAMAELGPLALAYQDELLAGLDPAERAALDRLLDRLGAAAPAPGGPPAPG